MSFTQIFIKELNCTNFQRKMLSKDYFQLKGELLLRNLGLGLYMQKFFRIFNKLTLIVWSLKFGVSLA